MRADTDQEATVPVVERNIEALVARRRGEEEKLGLEERIAAAMAAFTGSMSFVGLHALVYGAWILANLGVIPGVPTFDPTFVILAMVASVESIFLSTFILITQNRMMKLADRRADLNLQISLLAEHEVTRVLKLTSAIAARLQIPDANDPTLRELEKDVEPGHILDRIEQRQQSSSENEKGRR